MHINFHIIIIASTEYKILIYRYTSIILYYNSYKDSLGQFLLENYPQHLIGCERIFNKLYKIQVHFGVENGKLVHVDGRHNI